MAEYDVIVVGGGASGLMAAGRAAEMGKRVLLLEKNKKLGEKLGISGGGRCNITNAEDDVRVFAAMYGKAEQFLYSLFAQFGVKDTFTFFESRGLPLVVQARKRAFPASEKASDVIKVLEKYVREGGVVVRTGSRPAACRTRRLVQLATDLSGCASSTTRLRRRHPPSCLLRLLINGPR